MSYYYKYTFVSAQPLYGRIEEELKSYFDTGAIDNLLFSTWTDVALQRLGRVSYKVEHAVLDVCDFESRLPPDFKYVREARLTTSIEPISRQIPGAYYKEVSTCLNGDYVPDSCCGNSCNPEIVSLVYKTTREEEYTPLQLSYLLKPGTVRSRQCCGPDSPNLIVGECDDTFEIEGNRFRTNFRGGLVYLMYYVDATNSEGTELIPDNVNIQRYIESYIKSKIFEQLLHQVGDLSFQQSQYLYQMYKQEADERFIIALTEVKKETLEQKVSAINKTNNRFNKYITQMYGRNRRY